MRKLLEGTEEKSFSHDVMRVLLELAKKARFARVHAVPGWNLPYSATLRDPMDQSHTLDSP